MIPQDTFMVVVPVRPGQLPALRDLLRTMNRSPGVVDPLNALVPFAEFRTLHFARFVILDDRNLVDLSAYGETFPGAPIYLAFLGDCDGPSRRLLTALARKAEAGLRAIFRHCVDYDPEMDLLRFMRRHSVRPSACYINFPGMTVRRTREEAALHAALRRCLPGIPPEATPQEMHARLRQAIRDSGPIVSLEASTPLLFRLRQALYYIFA